jgi:hypothetical protein
LRGSQNRHKEQPIDGAVLREIIECALKVLGASALRALIHDLEAGGIVLEQDRSYSLKDVSRVLESLFGPDATGIIMARIYREVGQKD